MTSFSLSEGGQVHAVLTRAGLTGTRGRLVFVAGLVAVAWLPLVFLATRDGTVLRGVDHPLLGDPGVWVRLIIVVPLLVFAEPVADRVLGTVVDTFRRTGIVRAPDLPGFEEAVERTVRWATSGTVDLVLLVLALVIPHLVVASLPQLDMGTAWFGATADGDPTIAAAGRWYAWVSLPLVQFLLLRWLWRSVAWWALLWRVSKLDLAVAAAHPDRAGGLGLLALAPNAFLPVFVGLSALGAAGISNQIQFAGHHLTDARGPVVVFVVLEALLLLLPQLFFARTLGRARRRALIRYTVTGTAMTRGFEGQWTERPAEQGADLLDSPHSSAMIDFAGTYGLVEAMRPAGISLSEVIRVVLSLAAPFAPLLLYQYSVKEILLKVLAMVR
jgi:hypothetical protein